MRRALSGFVALVLCACDGQHISLGDGRSGATSVTDGGEGPAFGEPVLVAGLDAATAGEVTDDDPSLTADLREMLFDSRREGGAGREDIWSTTRTAVTSQWAAPRFEARLSSEARETGIALTADGLTVYFSSDRAGGAGGLDIYVSTRASRTAEWSEPEVVQEVSSVDDDLVSAVDPTGDVVYLARRVTENDDYDLFVSTRDGAAFGEPSPIAELNSDDEESDAFPVRGGLGVLFTRDEDLMFAERVAAGDPFGAPVPLTDLNSGDDDRDAWSTPELDRVVFSSDRSGEYRIYEARRR